MKRKILISIIGIALFAVAIGLSLNNTQEDNLKVKNIEALAHNEDCLMDASDNNGGNDYECSCSGGKGAESCSCSSSIASVSSSCSVSCTSGYYACCSTGGPQCRCIPIN
ncbi:MAG: NVEALA domain-containing protein [Bacteroidota bacterium]